MTASNHHWNLENRIPACDSLDGNERTERTCPYCMLVKITVQPPHGIPYRLWRTKDGQQFSGTNVPVPCTAGREKAAAQSAEVPFS